MEIDMKSLLCPLSSLRTSEATVRLTGMLVAALIALYALTGAVVVPLAWRPIMRYALSRAGRIAR
jgi:hypothetical protein